MEDDVQVPAPRAAGDLMVCDHAVAHVDPAHAFVIGRNHSRSCHLLSFLILLTPTGACVDAV